MRAEGGQPLPFYRVTYTARLGADTAPVTRHHDFRIGTEPISGQPGRFRLMVQWPYNRTGADWLRWVAPGTGGGQPWWPESPPSGVAQNRFLNLLGRYFQGVNDR
jgi:hypothetical protein